MKERIQQMLAEVAGVELVSPEAVENFRVAYLGRKGKVKDLMAAFKEVPGDQARNRPHAQHPEAGHRAARVEHNKPPVRPKASGMDATRPQRCAPCTHHPSGRPSRNRRYLSGLGFAVAEGPEIEDDWHVFSGLNFPQSTRPRHAGYVLCGARSRHLVAHPHEFGASSRDGAPGAAHALFAGPRVPQRGDFSPRSLHVPPN